MPSINLHHTDCLDFMRGLPDKAYDLCLTDPPYGVDLEYSTYDDTLGNWFALMNRFIPEATRVSKMVIMPSCSINKLAWIYTNFPPDWLICWYKGSPGHNSFIGFNDWEPLLVYGKTDGICIHDYMNIRNTETMGSQSHPCPKPVKWFEYLYKKILNGKGKVLDCFSGSGTSSIAAYNQGLIYDGCELDKDYFKAGQKRLDDHIAKYAPASDRPVTNKGQVKLF
jgi:site-specific DNA-methyltransferase (adenine-specific)